MSQEGIEQRLLERFRANYLDSREAFNRNDFEAAFALAPGDCVWDASGAGLSKRAMGILDYHAVMHGREEVIAFFQDWVEEFPDWRVDVDSIAEPTPGVLFVTSTLRGTGRVSGAPIARRITEVWDYRSRPVRISQHQDEADALEAAGLSE